jgi:tetratricopeptide (TPR) repeat protein
VRRILALGVACLLIGLMIWLALGNEPTAEGPAAVPMGEIVSQVLPGPDGEPEVWTLRKREGVGTTPHQTNLPEPSPRERPPDRSTESARTLNGLALEAWKHGDIEAALDYFDAAVERDPEDWVPRADYGRLLVMMTSYAEAGPHLERAAELNPSNPRVWLDLLSYYERTLQIGLAVEARRRAGELAGGRVIEQDRSGLWRLEDDSIFP